MVSPSLDSQIRISSLDLSPWAPHLDTQLPSWCCFTLRINRHLTLKCPNQAPVYLIFPISILVSANSNPLLPVGVTSFCTHFSSNPAASPVESTSKAFSPSYHCLVQATTFSYLDYSISLQTGLAAFTLAPLVLMLNTTANVICLKWKLLHAALLHWTHREIQSPDNEWPVSISILWHPALASPLCSPFLLFFWFTWFWTAARTPASSLCIHLPFCLKWASSNYCGTSSPISCRLYSNVTFPEHLAYYVQIQSIFFTL